MGAGGTIYFIKETPTGGGSQMNGHTGGHRAAEAACFFDAK